MLNNQFYTGIIHIKKTNEVFNGIHPALITASVFKKVHTLLRGKTVQRKTNHDILFRRLFRCRQCGYSLVGEKQKGRVYYRCQTVSCPTTSVREDAVEKELRSFIWGVKSDQKLKDKFLERVCELEKNDEGLSKNIFKSLQLQLSQIDEQQSRLIDALIDLLIDKETFKQKKAKLLIARREVEEKIRAISTEKGDTFRKTKNFLELASTSLLTFKYGNKEEKRHVVSELTLNRSVRGKNIAVELSEPAQILSYIGLFHCCGPHRGAPRTLNDVVDELVAYFKAEEEKKKRGTN